MLSSVVHDSGIDPPFYSGWRVRMGGSDPATDAAPNPLGLSGSPPLNISVLSSPTGPQNQTLLSDWGRLVALIVPSAPPVMAPRGGFGYELLLLNFLTAVNFSNLTLHYCTLFYSMSCIDLF